MRVSPFVCAHTARQGGQTTLGEPFIMETLRCHAPIVSACAYIYSKQLGCEHTCDMGFMSIQPPNTRPVTAVPACSAGLL